MSQPVLVEQATLSMCKRGGGGVAERVRECVCVCRLLSVSSPVYLRVKWFGKYGKGPRGHPSPALSLGVDN